MEMKAFDIYDEGTGAKARISLFGATVISWTTKQKEHLFLSEKAVLNGTKAIRGGIPPVFPVFGKATSGACKDLPQHGFARNHLWQIATQQASSATLRLIPEDIAGPAFEAWPYQFELLYTISLKDETLVTRLEIFNKDTKDFEFQTLLHTYFKVNDIADVHVEGLQDVTYKDKVSSSDIKEVSERVMCTAETDRVYPDVSDMVKISEKDKIIIEIDRQGLDDVVLWNPWVGCKNMADFGPVEGYKNMLCVEAGAVSKWHKLESGEKYIAKQVLTARL